MSQTVLVEMKNITKRFPGVLANEQVSLRVRVNEIHALLGENGAGKTTLMSILAGLYKPDEGEIYIRQNKISFNSPRDAIRSGIGMVHQHFRLINPFTVAENVILGSNSGKITLKMEQHENEIEYLANKFGLKVDPRAKVWQLSVGEQQRVEIIKMLYRKADVLILDEPTAVLTPQETNDLFTTLKSMAADGKAVIIITHKLNEVMDVADHITVLRNGKLIGSVSKNNTNKKELTRMMVGRDVCLEIEKEKIQLGETILELKNVNAFNDKGLPALQDVSLTIRVGEIMGIAGVAGNGQRELTEAINSLRNVESGQILLSGKNMTNCCPREVIDYGVAYIPEDRLGVGLIPNLNILDNIILKDYRKRWLGKGFFLDWQLIRQWAQKLVQEYGIKTTGLNSQVKLMSGGNLQRLLLAREISASPKLIVAVYPTRGLDVSAIEFVHKVLMEQRARGAAILLISEDLDEIFQLADQIAVLYEGKIMGVVPAQDTEVEEIGMLMAGIHKGEVIDGKCS